MLRSPLLLASTWLLTILAVLTAGLAVRLAPVEKTLAWPTWGPWNDALGFAAPLALVLAVLAALLLFVAGGAAKEGNRARPFAELLLFFPLLFAFVWFLLPAGRPGALAMVMAGLFLAAAWFLFRHGPTSTPKTPWYATKYTYFLDAGIILLPVLAGLAMGHSPDLKAGGYSLLLYPLYAFIQLVAFLHIPTTRLRAMGLSAENSTLFAALVFSLIHWPNPLVMLITFAGMLLWAQQFQNGRRLWQLALVMGLCATTVSQFLPDDLTRHMRVGPGYVRWEAMILLADDSPTNHPSDFIQDLYPQTIGRQVLPQELQTWLALIKEARPSTWAAMFLTSAESRKHLAAAGKELPPPDSDHWTDWPEEWKSRIEHFQSAEYWQRSGGNLAGFVGALYGDILGRGASAKEIGSWQTILTRNQKRRISELLLELNLRQGQTEFTGMSLEEFRFPN